MIGVLLTKHVMMNYASFVQGIDDIAALEAELQATHAQTREGRRLLGDALADVGVSLRVCWDSRSKQRSGQVLDIAERLKATQDLGSLLK